MLRRWTARIAANQTHAAAIWNGPATVTRSASNALKNTNRCFPRYERKKRRSRRNFQNGESRVESLGKCTERNPLGPQCVIANRHDSTCLPNALVTSAGNCAGKTGIANAWAAQHCGPVRNRLFAGRRIPQCRCDCIKRSAERISVIGQALEWVTDCAIAGVGRAGSVPEKVILHLRTDVT